MSRAVGRRGRIPALAASVVLALGLGVPSAMAAQPAPTAPATAAPSSTSTPATPSTSPSTSAPVVTFPTAGETTDVTTPVAPASSGRRGTPWSRLWVLVPVSLLIGALATWGRKTYGDRLAD